ncbi:hypothetical protein ERO13_D12G203700v2 [Gossypium hirsutum]|uniref:Uncharacterized protein n=1 Tax=Gossypium raimondii TaxID=29730 RepID=A0A0D2TAG7_GOSRA|nr:hypothetical protein ERO13_D12G203700v2 [Gossypium hirsutum]KJB51486.1 hypothetical protein B456_008G218500 [Gossypium raimondii]MBA0593196.1 hypothetical protein [Gossypium raimondii]
MPSNSKLPSSRSARDGRRNALVWCGVIICTLLTLAVIIAGIVIFVGYLVMHPRVPYVSVINAQLDRIQIDHFNGFLEIQVTIIIRARNGNRLAHATFLHSNYTLSFEGEDIAQLVAPAFEVNKNSSVDFNYEVQSSPIPLGPEQADQVEAGFNKDLITFVLKGGARVRWKVGRLGPLEFSCHLDCRLHFHASNLSYVPSSCTSKAK